jgi:hypothetical protein
MPAVERRTGMRRNVDRVDGLSARWIERNHLFPAPNHTR